MNHCKITKLFYFESLRKHVSDTALSYDRRVCLFWNERNLEKAEVDFEQQIRQLEKQCKQNVFSKICLVLYLVHSIHLESMVKLRQLNRCWCFNTCSSAAIINKM